MILQDHGEKVKSVTALGEGYIMGGGGKNGRCCMVAVE